MRPKVALDSVVLDPNLVISHYRIIEPLGAGGMGEVYLAEDTMLRRPVALKLLPQAHTRDEVRLRRFTQEARSASALNHPNILTIYEIGEADGHHFIASEFVDGQTLRAVLRTTASMETGEALRVAAQVASGLAAAHGAGIVHRDIKPENIMLRRDGYVKVLDFGLAKLTEAPALQQADASASTKSLAVRTESGVVVGTAHYMSPEQATGKPVDARSDIFSLGAVLYEMVTGQRAFQGDSLIEALAAIVNQEPRPMPARISSELARVILRCLRKEPARRYQTMADLTVALEDLREESLSPLQPPRRRRWAWGALAVLVVAGVFTWRAWRTPENQDPLRAVPLTTLPGTDRYPSFSSDGNYVAFTWTGPKEDNPDVYVQQIGSGSPLRLTTDPGNDYNPVWSPDGRWIAFLRSGSETGTSEVRLIAPLGGPERTVTVIRLFGGISLTPPYLAWVPDSSHLVVTDSPGAGKPDALFIVSLETGEKRQLTDPSAPASGDTNPAVSPDGNSLVFRRQAGGVFNGELYQLPLARGLTAAGAPRRLTPAIMDALYPTWLPDSRTILFSAKAGLWRLAVSGDDQPTRLPFVGEDGFMPVVSRPLAGRPSRLVYVRSFDDTNIWRVEIPAREATAPSLPRAFISSTRGEWFPEFSPDGHRLAFASDRSGEGAIWLADADGSNPVELAPMGAFATGAPRWSPDGQRIVFHSNPLGQGDIFVIAAAGGKPRNLTAHPANDSFPSFSRDGKWIYFSSNRNAGARQVWKIPAAGGDAVLIPNSVGYGAVESPDGAYIYSVETLEKPSPLWRQPVSGGVPAKVLEGVVLSNFVVRERGIYYIDRPSGPGGVYYLDKPSGRTRLQYFDFATRRSTTMAPELGNVGNFLTVSSDGRTILYARMDSSVDDLMLVEGFR